MPMQSSLAFCCPQQYQRTKGKKQAKYRDHSKSSLIGVTLIKKPLSVYTKFHASELEAYKAYLISFV